MSSKNKEPQITRRQTLKGLTGLATAATAGCLGGNDDETRTEGPENGQRTPGGNETNGEKDENGEEGVDPEEIDIGVLLEPQDHESDYTDAFHSAALTLDGSDANEYTPEITVTGPEGEETLGEGDFWTPDKLDDYMIEAVLNGETVDTQEITREELAEQLFNYEGNRERIEKGIDTIPYDTDFTTSSQAPELGTKASDIILMKVIADEEDYQQGPGQYGRRPRESGAKFISQGRKTAVSAGIVEGENPDEFLNAFDLQHHSTYKGIDLHELDNGNLFFHHPEGYNLAVSREKDAYNLIDTVEGEKDSVLDEFGLPPVAEEEVTLMVSYGQEVDNGSGIYSQRTIMDQEIDVVVMYYDIEEDVVKEEGYRKINDDEWEQGMGTTTVETDSFVREWTGR